MLTDVQTCIENVYSLAQPTEALEGAMGNVLQRAVELFARLNDPATLADTDRLREAKQQAIAAVDALEATLLGARPTGLAVSMGLGW